MRDQQGALLKAPIAIRDLDMDAPPRAPSANRTGRRCSVCDCAILVEQARFCFMCGGCFGAIGDEALPTLRIANVMALKFNLEGKSVVIPRARLERFDIATQAPAAISFSGGEFFVRDTGMLHVRCDFLGEGAPDVRP